MSEQTWTILLTDIVDSTGINQAIGDEAMIPLWAAHDRVSRDLVRRCRGREIDRSDGFLLLFSSVGDAAAYALAYHRSLAALEQPLQARVGLHVGPVQLRQNSAEDVALGAKPIEVEGLVKPVAARIMSLAQPGQTLLSAAAQAALGETPLRLRSHGHWRLKGLADPIELFEAGDETTRFCPPSDGAKGYRVVRKHDLWLPLREVRHGLPAERAGFVGREGAMHELAQRYESGARLVSLLGVGGGGKTRLAIRFSWAWMGEFPGGCWFCDLSSARDIDGIVSAVAQALEIPLGKTDPIEQLGNAMAGRGRCLVILDNFEQVARHADATLGHWLERAGEACFLVTTREVLGIAGEQALALPPLSQLDGEALFVLRARAAKSDFNPPEQERIAIGPLVKLLDGLPLAIELCAARVRLMPPSALLERMTERFDLLSSGGRRRDRQATLRATLDWSWQLLEAHEKGALAQLSVFEGGFTLEAAEAVLDLSAFADAPLAMDVVQSLVDKSLVMQAPGDRFALLVSVQDYADQQLRAGASIREAVPGLVVGQQRHGRYFAGLDKAPLESGASVELDNLVAACRRAVLRGDADLAVAALERACIVLLRRGPMTLALDLALQVKALPNLTGSGPAIAGKLAGTALKAQGKPGLALDQLAEALQISRERAESGRVADTLVVMASIESTSGNNTAARRHLEEALDLVRKLDAPLLEARVHTGLGFINFEEGHLEQALSDALCALDHARAAANLRQESIALDLIGQLNATLGHADSGIASIEQALCIARQIGDRITEATTLCNLAIIERQQAKPEGASDKLRAAVEIVRELGHRRLEAAILGNLGQATEATGRIDEALRLYAVAARVAKDVHDIRTEGQILGYQGRCNALRGGHELAREQFERGAGLLKKADDAHSLALLLCCQAKAELAAGNPSLAKAALSEAETLAKRLALPPLSEINQEIEKLCKQATS